MPGLQQLTDEELLAEARKRQIGQLSNADLIAEARKRQIPELREQPGFLARMTAPGGFLGPENVGITGGGMLGAKLGAPLGPMGALGGGVLGAGIGGLVGRGGELMNEPELPADALGQLGQASQRGMMSEMAGQVGGKLIGGGIAALRAPFAAHMTPPRQAIQAAAAQEGITLTGGQVTGSSVLGQIENLVPRTPFSVGQSESFLKGQSGDVVNALQDVVERRAPGVSTDLQEIGMRLDRPIRAAIEAPENFIKTQQQAAKGALTDFMERIAPGSVRDLQQAGTIASGTLRSRSTQVRKSASNLYKAAFGLAGDQKIPLTPYREAVQKLAGEEGPLGSFATGLSDRGATVVHANQTLLDQSGENLSKIVAEVSRRPNMTAGERLLTILAQTPQSEATLETMHGVRSELLDIIRQEGRHRLGTSKEGRAALILYAGMEKSMKQMKDLNPQAYDVLKAANSYYKHEVAQVFEKPEVIGTLAHLAEQNKHDLIVPLLYGPNKSEGPLLAFKKAIGDEGFEKVSGSWMQSLLDESVDNGAFSLSKAIREIDKYDDATLKAALGDVRAKGLRTITNTFRTVERDAAQYASPDIIEALGKKATGGKFEEMVPGFLGPRKSVGPAQDVRSVIGEGRYAQAGAGQIQHLIDRAGNPQTGEFSLDRFLTATGPQNYSPGMTAELFGPETGRMETLRGVLTAIQQGRISGANSSETARALIGWGQITSTMGLAAKIAYEGEVSGGDVATAGVLLTPNLAGRILFSPQGIRWLTSATRPMLPEELAKIAVKLAALATMPSVNEMNRRPPEQKNLRDALEKARQQGAAPVGVFQ